MEESALVQAFIASLGTDNNLRMQAHTYLQSISFTPGLIPCLMSLSLSHSTLEVRQLSVIHLKNLAKQWKDPRLCVADKILLRSSLYNCLSPSIPDRIRSQYEEIAHIIIKNEYPWDSFIEEIHSALQNSNFFYSGLIMLYHACKIYELVMTNLRNNLIVLIDNFFPVLIGLLEKFMSLNDVNKYKFIQPILMIYWSCFYIELPASQANEVSLGRWITCFREILKISPSETSQKNAEDKERDPEWVCRKWAAQIVCRFFSRYFNKLYLREQNLFISDYFQAVWAVDFYELILSMVLSPLKHEIPEMVLNLLLKYINQSIKFEKIFATMTKETIRSLLVTVSIELLMRSPKDEELWNSNPIEFIRKENDSQTAYYSTKASALLIISSFCQTPYLVPFTNYLLNELPKSSDLIKKETLMFVFGSISDSIKKHEKFKENIEKCLNSTVYPEFFNPIGFLRARAAWVYSKFSHLEYSDSTMQENVFKAICSLMNDPELPVRYTASVALPRLLHWDICKVSLSTEIQGLLQIYLKLMQEIEAEEVVESLESIISTFPQEVKPFTTELSDFLIESFESTNTNLNSENNDNNSMASVSILNTLAKLIDVFCSDTSQLFQISTKLAKIFEICFKSADFFEGGINLLTCLLYYSPNNSLPHLFKYLEHLTVSVLGSENVKAFAGQYCEEIFPAIGNLISKYPLMALEQIVFILEFCFKLLKEKDEDSIYLACEILLVIAENFQRNIDQHVLAIIDNAFEAFKLENRKKIKIACAQVVFASVWNNPYISIQRSSVILTVSEYAKEFIKYFNESLARIHLIFGLSSLFCCNLPQDLQSASIGLLKLVLKACHEIELNQAEDKQNNIKIVDVKLDFNQRDEEDDEDESIDDDDYPFGTEPVEFFDSKFEDVDHISFIKNVFEVYKKINPDAFNAIFQHFNDKEKKIVVSILAYPQVG